MGFVRALGIFLCLIASPLRAEYDTSAKTAYVVDTTTGTVLLAKNPDVPVPPASMSKLMTLNMLFEALRDGRIAMDTAFGVSHKAHRMGGSKMFLSQGSRVSVRDLIQGIVVQSGNDACIVVAEGLAGTEDGFARLMNRRAQALGMKGSTFTNSSGWPDPAQRMSARDLAFLAQRLIEEFPEYYGFFAQESFTWEEITQRNRNPLLGLGLGVDGLKTGHTQEAGYGLVGSAALGARRLVFVITGLESASERAREGEQLINWAFRQFVARKLVDKGTVLAHAPVWTGARSEVGLMAGEDISVLLAASSRGILSATVVYRGPIEAPVKAGDELAQLVIEREGLHDAIVPLVASTGVARGGFLPRVRSASRVLIGLVAEQVRALF